MKGGRVKNVPNFRDVIYAWFLTISAGEISTLDHEILDDAVELWSLVTFSNILVLGQFDEVLGGDGDGLTEDAQLNGAYRLTSNLNVEKDLKTKKN